jgi:molybdopterin molybdotransferase
VQVAGGEPLILPVAADLIHDLDVLIRKGLQSDLLLLSGGVSMGKYDLVEEVLEKLGASFVFTGVLIQPGKPVVFGAVTTGQKTTPFFGLPGNPVSTMVTFQLFARVLLDALSGAEPRQLHFAQARLASELKVKTGLTRFLPGRLGGTHEQPSVEVVKWHGSGDLMAIANSNCYIVVPPDREHFEASEQITILPF